MGNKMVRSLLENEYQNIVNLLGDGINKLHNKSFYITGATGLVASYLVDFLMWYNNKYSRDITVYAVSSKIENLKKRFMLNNNLYFIEQNLNEPLKEKYKVDYVIHAASNAHPLAFSNDPVGTMKTNLIGTINLLEMIKDTPAYFMYISTGEIYGNNIDMPFKEDDCGYIDSKLVRSCYPESKRAAETLCVSYNHQYNIKTNILRLCYVYGATITNENSRADAQFLRNALNGENIIMKSEGLQKRTYCYVADAVYAMLYVILYGEDSQVYNVANPNSIASIKEYATILSKLADVSLQFDIPSEIEKQGYSKPLDSILDASKLQNLGWKPQYDLTTGLSHTLQIKREQKYV